MINQGTPDISVVVVSFNTRDLLASCLRSIQSTVVGFDLEVIVVDNASWDGSADMVARDFPEARLILNPQNLGFARANNQGIRESRGRYLLLLNSDAELLPRTGEAMFRFMEEHPTAGVVGAQLRNPDGSFQWSYADFPTLRSEILLMTRLSGFIHPPCYPSHPVERSGEVRQVDWVSGACIMIRRSAIDEVGMLDEGYFMYAEEVDWCYRMVKAGWRVYYLPTARVVHWSGRSADRIPTLKRGQLYRSKLLFMRKHKGPVAATAFRVALNLSSIAKLAGWSLASMNPRGSSRGRAMQNVRSYLTLLSNLAHES